MIISQKERFGKKELLVNLKCIKEDYKDYINSMQRKDYVITDNPWNLNDKPPKVARQLKYSLWGDNVLEMFHIFKCVNTDLLFVWVINAVIQEMFQGLSLYNSAQKKKSEMWINKNHFCWRKLTNRGNEFFGTGHWNRNCSEDLYIFAKPSCKPIRLNMKSHFAAAKGMKTLKPKIWEAELLKNLGKSGKAKGAYLFSGTDNGLYFFSDFDIDCVDILFDERHL